MLEKVKTLKNN